MVNGKAVIDADKCINCGICENGNGQKYNGCPVKAISK
ncbi:MAG: 4Fe-4S binding protein [Candidatus Cloacimonetes bacterium]|nr:4Fe-4S binding protein [Candidatus Cloacimonadota bacterium]